MLRFKVRLTRDLKFVTLELFEGRRTRGTWRRIEEESNSSLGHEEGTWENRVFESPGGVTNIRLYDPADVRAALLKDYLTGRTGGEGLMFVPDFAGSFGSDAFRWNQIPADLGAEWSNASRVAIPSPPADPALMQRDSRLG
ncbi:MAG: hypothetical protein ABI868_11290 [Acidobacteriota bacterium]